jgi:hypothetical protein
MEHNITLVFKLELEFLLKMNNKKQLILFQDTTIGCNLLKEIN